MREIVYVSQYRKMSQIVIIVKSTVMLAAMRFKERTIQKRVSLAKSSYSSMVERTLNMRHTRTTMNLKEEEETEKYIIRLTRRIKNEAADVNKRGREGGIVSEKYEIYGIF